MPARLKRRSFLTFIATAMVGSTLATPTASACCLTDWLYGRQPAYAAAVPLPVTTGTPYTAGYTPYTASYTPYTSSYTAGYTPLVTANPVASTYSVQRPAYSAVPLNNPSVYTGMPVTNGYRGLATAGNPFYGTGNVYPNNLSSSASTVTALRPANVAPATGLPTTGYPTPIRSGLSRFFNSLLGTGYRTSYYTAPITYYRPTTSIDPVTGTTVTVQQPCSSTVQQLQRTPYTTLQPFVGGSSIQPNGSLQPCGGMSCENGLGTSYGASPIPSTMPSTFAPSSSMPLTSMPSTTVPSTLSPYGGVGGYNSGDLPGGSTSGLGNGDYQPLAPPTLPTQPNYSGRPDSSTNYPPSTYPPSTSNFSNPSSNLSPLTGADAFPPSYSSQSAQGQDWGPSPSDRSPMRAPETQDARSATSSVDPNAAYRQGYEAGRATAQGNRDAPQSLNDSPYQTDRYQTESDETERAPSESYYQLDPPENSRPSTEESMQRSRYEIERDQRDLRGLTAQNGNADPSWHRVRPIPAPENYRNPFTGSTQPVSRNETKVGAATLVPPSYQSPSYRSQSKDELTAPELTAPSLLPALPRPSTQFNPGYGSPSQYRSEVRLSVPVREASMQRELPQKESPKAVTNTNAWQAKVRQQSQDTGWYATGK